MFLTAWQSLPPHLTAVGYHSSLARGKQINFLAANRSHGFCYCQGLRERSRHCRNFPPKHASGSGVYSSAGVLASFTSHGADTESHLVLASLPVTPVRWEISVVQPGSTDTVKVSRRLEEIRGERSGESEGRQDGLH